jgi:hypothetical protein
MCGLLNQIAERPEDLPTVDEVGKFCIYCGTVILDNEPVHRSGDGEVAHKACYDDLNDEDAHFYEPVPEEVV